jgi:hypothetical protein
MKLTVKGKPPRKLKKKLVEEAVVYYSEKIFKKALRKKLKIHIEFVDLPADLMGDCPYYDPIEYKYSYKMLINNKLGFRPCLSTIAHELVHIKQYASREYVRMSFKDKHIVKWKNKKYNFDKIDYWDHPWEIEANGRELGLYIRMINHMIEEGRV